MRKIITYGTFDLLHVGHVRLLKRLREMGDHLIVGVSTDEFNQKKGKRAVFSYEDRAEIVRSITYVDQVIPEESWDQKRRDILEHGVDVFAIGADWKGKFDDLQDICEVVYLERTEGISTTAIRHTLSQISPKTIEDLKVALELLNGVIGVIK
ncbi:MAG: glycerol-3-phosphate cytidylyltransferase [Myxococcales bacterium]|jgi:glycerol-3-phosphate cytidylyltransferase|nr:glycerol-3-phosphate cytidylyltransferase [Myxococcales bacterium]